MFSMSQRNEIIFLHAGGENFDDGFRVTETFPEIHVAAAIAEPARTTPIRCPELINLRW
jgi:hypothetical protein